MEGGYGKTCWEMRGVLLLRIIKGSECHNRDDTSRCTKHLKIAKMVSFMLLTFYHHLKKSKQLLM